MSTSKATARPLLNPRTLSAREAPIAATPAQIKVTVSAARRAGEAWAARPLSERARALEVLARLITTRRAAGSALSLEETGRAESLAALSEFNNVVGFARGAAVEARRALAPVKVKLSAADFPGKSARVEQLPRGVVGIIAPWNYPVSNFYKSLFPALLAGNALILKPSEYTPRLGQWLADLATEALGEDLVSCIQGGGEVGRALIESGIDAVVFTGSVATGRRVATLAAEALIPCSLELGGKDGALVLEDAELDRTALGLTQWSMFNAGQDCSSIERVYVVESIADELVARLTQSVGALTYWGDGIVDATLGADSESRESQESQENQESQESQESQARAVQSIACDVGPLQNQAQLDHVSAQVEAAIARGAVKLCGGSVSGVGYGFQPTVLDHCTPEMDLVREETFGPVLAIVRVPDVETGIKEMNRSRYGLNGSVWTRDLKRGEHIASRLEVGVALVNNHSFTGSLPNAPWAGVKETGYGVASSRWSYHTFARPRTLVIDKNSKPDPFWLPLDSTYQHFVELIAQKSLGGGLGVLFRLIRLLGRRVVVIKGLLRGQRGEDA